MEQPLLLGRLFIQTQGSQFNIIVGLIMFAVMMQQILFIQFIPRQEVAPPSVFIRNHIVATKLRQT